MCYFCSDMDECELGLDNCHPNATCSDVEGGDLSASATLGLRVMEPPASVSVV